MSRLKDSKKSKEFVKLGKFFADEIFVILLWIASIFLVLGFITPYAINYFKPKCNGAQLLKVISEVDECNKKNVICSSEKKDQIIKDLCK